VKIYHDELNGLNRFLYIDHTSQQISEHC